MKTSVTARATRHRSQPLPTAACDKIITPGCIGLAKQTTYIMEPGEAVIVNANIPGVRKHVISRKGENKIVGDNMEKPVTLKNANDWAFLEWTGHAWTVLYGAKK